MDKQNNFFTDSLTGKMVKRLIKSLAVGIFLIFFLYLGCSNMLQHYFSSSGFFYDREIERINGFQQYVDTHHLSSTDSVQIRKWVKERNVLEFTISKGKWLLFDISYTDEILPGSIEIDHHPWRFYYTVSFADGDANVSVYEGYDKKYYHILLAVSIILGFAAFLAIFISGLQEDVAYIKCLEKEVNMISHGNLQKNVTVKGRDELAQLALGLNQMRKTLYEQELTETELRTAQEKLVLGMSHDLRTPLTGLLTYMEILRKQEHEGCISREYIDKAYDKILQIKNLSDQMFEYFFIHSHKGSVLEPPEDISSAFRDYLSEMCALLEYDGFFVNASHLKWTPALIQINTDYLGRIINNIISNIEKYGDKNKEVQIQLKYSKTEILLSIQNSIAKPELYIEGTGIGIKNITLMMQQLGGKTSVSMTEKLYEIKLYFPICQTI